MPLFKKFLIEQTVGDMSIHNISDLTLNYEEINSSIAQYSVDCTINWLYEGTEVPESFTDFICTDSKIYFDVERGDDSFDYEYGSTGGTAGGSYSDLKVRAVTSTIKMDESNYNLLSLGAEHVKIIKDGIDQACKIYAPDYIQKYFERNGYAKQVITSIDESDY